jgi:hypothetical protein
MAPLRFLDPRNETRFSFARAGEEQIGGVRVWKVTYDETERPAGVGLGWLRLMGAFWIEPRTGCVLRTTLDLREAQRLLRVVQYGPRASVRTAASDGVPIVLVPFEMRDDLFYGAVYATRPAGVQPPPNYAGQNADQRWMDERGLGLGGYSYQMNATVSFANFRRLAGGGTAAPLRG